MHHPSQVGFAQPCEAFYDGDLEEEEEGEIELEGGCCCSNVWAPGTKRLIDITLLVTITNSAPKE